MSNDNIEVYNFKGHDIRCLQDDHTIRLSYYDIVKIFERASSHPKHLKWAVGTLWISIQGVSALTRPLTPEWGDLIIFARDVEVKEKIKLDISNRVNV